MRLARHNDSHPLRRIHTRWPPALSGGADKDRTIRISDLGSGREIHRLREFSTGLEAWLPRRTARRRRGIGDPGGPIPRFPRPRAPREIPGSGRTDGPRTRRQDLRCHRRRRREISSPIAEVSASSRFSTSTKPASSRSSRSRSKLPGRRGSEIVLYRLPRQEIHARTGYRHDDLQAENVPSPIKARLIALAMGSDSDGPLMAGWLPDASVNIPNSQVQFRSIPRPSPY